MLSDAGVVTAARDIKARAMKRLAFPGITPDAKRELEIVVSWCDEIIKQADSGWY